MAAWGEVKRRPLASFRFSNTRGEREIKGKEHLRLPETRAGGEKNEGEQRMAKFRMQLIWIYSTQNGEGPETWVG